MRRLALAGFLLALPFLLQACDGTPELDVRTFNLEFRAGYEAAELVEPYVFSDRSEAPGAMSATETALTVRETRDNLDKIARVLETFDQPVPAIRLRFQLIEADSFREEDPSIADVTQELRNLFRFEGYRLHGEVTVSLAGTRRGSQFTQRFPELGEASVELQGAARVLGNGRVRLERIVLSDPWHELLSTSVSLTPGQTLVIGGTQAGGPGEESRHVILTVQALEL